MGHAGPGRRAMVAKQKRKPEARIALQVDHAVTVDLEHPHQVLVGQALQPKLGIG